MEHVDELIELIKDDCLCVELGGSRCLPFIRHPHDCDIIIICKDEEQVNKVKTILIEGEYRNTYRSKYGIDIIVKPLSYSGDGILDAEFAYCPHYSKVLYGKRPEVDILKNEARVKQAVLNRMNRLLSKRIEGKSVPINELKFWYRFYLVMCILKNQSYELTEEQIETVNILHDKEESQVEEKLKLIDEIIKEIKLWQI